MGLATEQWTALLRPRQSVTKGLLPPAIGQLAVRRIHKDQNQSEHKEQGDDDRFRRQACRSRWRHLPYDLCGSCQVSAGGAVRRRGQLLKVDAYGGRGVADLIEF